MKKIEKLEQAKQQNANLNEWGINRTFYWAYRSTLETNNNTINFNDVIWENDVEPIIKNCMEFKINTITISTKFSSLVIILGLFTDNGCNITGMTKVELEQKDLFTKEPKIEYAIEIKIPQ